MIDVHVSINGIVMYCDESVASLNWGNGYSVQKTYLKDIPFISNLLMEMTI